MRVLVACEFSGAVRDAFAARGHDAWSCDLIPSERPGNHYEGDVIAVLGDGWDLMVAHPPCTHLAVSGARWFKDKRAEQEEALSFVRHLLAAPIPRIALENPVSVISSKIRKPDQIIQPWQFGHDASKATCLWLKGLSPLRPTRVVDPRYSCACGVVFDFALGKYGCPNCHGESEVRPIWGNQTPSGQNKIGPSADRWKIRSATYAGIAQAMAAAWGAQ
jgi:hypothetical protein